MKILPADGTSIHPHQLDSESQQRALDILTPRERQRLEGAGYIKVYRDRQWVFTLSAA